MRSPLYIVLAGSVLASAAPLQAQEDEPAARPDSVITDLPGELAGVLVDSAEDARFALLAPPLPLGPVAGDVVTWDRERIRLSNAVSLSELIAEMVAGVSIVRADFFSGPHHLVDGPFGPGALEVRVDGRPLLPMIGSQVDLTRIPLAALDGVSVRRGAAGVEIDLTMLRREEARAYSRVEAGTGQPDAEVLRLAFASGFRSDFSLAAAFDLFDAGGTAISESQSLFADIGWAPGDGMSGLNLQVDAGSFSRGVGVTEKGNRRRVVVGGRHGLSDRVQLSGWLGSSSRELDEQLGTGVPARTDDVADGGLEVRGAWSRAWARAGLRWSDHPAMASSLLEASVGGTAFDGVRISAAGSLGTWEGFRSREGRLAVDWELPLGNVVIGAEGTAGIRGAPFVASDDVHSDSVRFEAIAGRIVVPISGIVLSARAQHQRVGRQLAFGTGFDVGGAFQPAVHVTGLEAVIEAPVVPLSWLVGGLNPLRVRGFYRRNTITTSRVPFFVPASSYRGEVFLEDTLLEGDLQLRMSIGLEHRDAWTAPAVPGSGSESLLVPAQTSWDLDVNVRIVGMIIFWRLDNMRSAIQQDLPGLQFPVSRGLFGLRWEFLD